MSAATVIMLGCSSFNLSPHSLFMVHNYSSVIGGKGGEVYDQASYERKWSEQLLRETYEGFLNETEILSILDGKDLWFGMAEAKKKLEARISYFRKAQKAASQALAKLTKPKKQKVQAATELTKQEEITVSEDVGAEAPTPEAPPSTT